MANSGGWHEKQGRPSELGQESPSIGEQFCAGTAVELKYVLG